MGYRPKINLGRSVYTEAEDRIQKLEAENACLTAHVEKLQETIVQQGGDNAVLKLHCEKYEKALDSIKDYPIDHSAYYDVVAILKNIARRAREGE